MILEAELADVEYDGERCRDVSLSLSERILNALKRLPLDRYKIVCCVVIGEKLSQNGVDIGHGIFTASRCMWDCERDNFTSVTYSNSCLYAVATIYGVYKM